MWFDKYIGLLYVDEVNTALVAEAAKRGLTINPMDPLDTNIDAEPDRLNVIIDDATGKIIRFYVG